MSPRVETRVPGNSQSLMPPCQDPLSQIHPRDLQGPMWISMESWGAQFSLEIPRVCRIGPFKLKENTLLVFIYHQLARLQASVFCSLRWISWDIVAQVICFICWCLFLTSDFPVKYLNLEVTGFSKMRSLHSSYLKLFYSAYLIGILFCWLNDTPAWWLEYTLGRWDQLGDPDPASVS